jgi:tryptophan-rich sensory protein
MTTARQVIGLVVSVAVCLGCAGIGSLLTMPAISTWYKTIRKPTWNPPNWLFGPVWTLLYLSMAVAAWLVWRQSETSSVSLALALFGIQLALNLAWSAIFFHYHQIGAAVVDVVFLWIFILATTPEFWKVAPAASWLMVPYLAWVTFASILNATVWSLNK